MLFKDNAPDRNIIGEAALSLMEEQNEINLIDLISELEKRAATSTDALIRANIAAALVWLNHYRSAADNGTTDNIG